MFNASKIATAVVALLLVGLFAQANRSMGEVVSAPRLLVRGDVAGEWVQKSAYPGAVEAGLPSSFSLRIESAKYAASDNSGPFPSDELWTGTMIVGEVSHRVTCKFHHTGQSGFRLSFVEPSSLPLDMSIWIDAREDFLSTTASRSSEDSLFLTCERDVATFRVTYGPAD